MRILFLNQYFPPDDAPTGVLLAEVAESLREVGHEVELLDAQQEYRAGQAAAKRIRRELAALWRILWAGLRATRPDVIVSGTSPPLLLVVATLLALRFRARSIHWAMDLYPDLALALGEIRPGGMAAMLETVVSWCYRRADLTVALDSDMAARLKARGARTECQRPWVTRALLERAETHRTPASEPSTTGAWRWIYSGNLGRAHEWETLLAAQQIIEAEEPGIRLVFQGGGPGRKAAEERAAAMGLRTVEWRSYADEAVLIDSLLGCDAFTVTQKPEVAGMLWPSKLGLLLTLPRPLVFVGPPDGAIAGELRAFPHAGVFAAGDAEGVAAWVLAQQRNGRPVPPRDVLDGGAHRAASLKRWQEFISEVSSPERGK